MRVDTAVEKCKGRYPVLAMDRLEHENADAIIIATERDWDPGPHHVWLFSFGAYGNTHIAVDGHTLDDALEIAAEVLKEVAPGLFTEPEYPEGIGDIDDDEEEKWRAIEEAERDLTCTESGYLASWEWTVTELASERVLRKLDDWERKRS